MKILVIGCGTMGRGIAQVLAGNGYDVYINDINAEIMDAGLHKMDSDLEKQVTKGKMSETAKTELLNHIKPVLDLNDARDAMLVIEAAAENLEIKKELFRKLDEIMNPEAILASNTSSLSITEIASATKRPGHVAGMHFFNPAPVMKLIEVTAGLTTEQMVLDTIVTIAKEIGKEPVLLTEAPGFIVNRILIPMINEAAGVLSDGIASASDIDKAMVLGCNHPMGPLALADLIGIDVVLSIMEVLHREFGEDKYRPNPYLRKLVRAGKLGRKSGSGFYQYE